jgi:hypothetical protein
VGLGAPDSAVREFEVFTPYVVKLLALQGECPRLGSDYKALGIALDALQTTAYHFTRQRYFYHAIEAARAEHRQGEGRLSERGEAIAAFEELRPYVTRLRALQGRCRPFGRDYLALDIARQGLETAAFHFTQEPNFYGAKNDSAGPVRPGF